jgi:4-hydroxy-2-oxoheptanedioate aldolase
MYRPNSLKTRLKNGEKVFGSWNVLASSFATEVMGYTGFDFIIIDHEHGCGDLMTLGHQFQALSPTSTTALVRVPSHDSSYIRRVLDLGAEGVVVPSVNTAEEARSIVQACHYPSFGSRGAAPGTIRASSFGAEANLYARTASENTLVICQIETVEGVQNADAIAAVEGVDMIFIGPYDLSASAGLMGEMDHPDVLALIEKAEAAARAAGKPLGSILRPGVSLKEVYDRGYQLISTGSDSSRLRAACLSDVAKFQDAIGQDAGPKLVSIKAS